MTLLSRIRRWLHREDADEARIRGYWIHHNLDRLIAWRHCCDELRRRGCVLIVDDMAAKMMAKD